MKKLFFLLSVCLLLVMIPRFNRNDIGIKRFTGDSLGDSPQYVRYVETFRGEDVDYPDQPFSYRPLVPAIASVFLFSPETSINIVNLIFWETALLFFLLSMNIISPGKSGMLWAGLLYVFSFGHFYYGTVTLIDSAGAVGISIGLYLILKEKYAFVALTAFVFAFGKETVLGLVPVLFFFQIIEKRNIKKAFIWSGLSFAGFLIGSILSMKLFGKGAQDFSPGLGTDTFLSNITRIRAWFSGILAFGIPGFFGLFASLQGLVKRDTDFFKRYGFMLSGIAVYIGLYVLSMLIAYTDGRFLIPAALFSCLMAGKYINEKRRDRI